MRALKRGEWEIWCAGKRIQGKDNVCLLEVDCAGGRISQEKANLYYGGELSLQAVALLGGAGCTWVTPVSSSTANTTPLH